MKIFNKIMLLSCLAICLACSNGGNKTKSDGTVQKKKNPTTKAVEKNTPKATKQEKKETAPVSTLPPNQIAKAKEIIAALDHDAVDKIDGQKKFKLFCSTCHGFKGDMMVNGAKDLTISKISLENAVAQVYHGKGLMTPYKGVLKDHEIVAVCKYIETLRK